MVVFFSHLFLHDPGDAEKRVNLCQYWRAVHMHAFKKGLKYVIFTKLDQHISDCSDCVEIEKNSQVISL